jgi:hypothetical protein
MKKILVVSLLILGFFCSIKTTQAQSVDQRRYDPTYQSVLTYSATTACSTHGGVYYSVGQSSFGNFVCNDMWTGNWGENGQSGYTYIAPQSSTNSFLEDNSSANTVAYYNDTNGCDYYIVKTPANDYSLLEWYGEAIPSKGDIIYGNTQTYGFKNFYDSNQSINTYAWIEDNSMTASQVVNEYLQKCNY